MCTLVLKVMVGCCFMRYSCFAERIICSFIALSTWRLLVIFGISVLLDPYILWQSWWKNFVPSWIWSKPIHLRDSAFSSVRRSHRLHRGSSLVMCELSYTFFVTECVLKPIWANVIRGFDDRLALWSFNSASQVGKICARTEKISVRLWIGRWVTRCPPSPLLRQ